MGKTMFNIFEFIIYMLGGVIIIIKPQLLGGNIIKHKIILRIIGVILFVYGCGSLFKLLFFN